jgi:phenylalanyl-tRNA synthetase beta chain
MLFLKSWLEDYIDLSDITNEQLSTLVSSRSSEVEEVLVIDDYFNNQVVIGKITNVRKHPDANNLNYFDVQINSQGKTTQIVSAAKNVREGLIVPVALIGANLGGFVIGPKKMRGVDSNGLCLGMSELNLETSYSSGLWEFNSILDESQIGKSICKVFPDKFPSQTIFDIKTLPDKISKIGNHLGMSIEIATCLKDLSRLKSYAKSLTHATNLIEMVKEIDKINIEQSINRYELKDETNYTAAFAAFNINLKRTFDLDHIKRQRMILLGENLTGTIADLSNYIQIDVGQPTHFFKQSNINSNLVIKRLDIPTKWEGLGQLKSTTLKEGTIALFNDTELLALPAISGGVSSSVSNSDTQLTLELASFNFEAVARNSFGINYRSSAAKLYCSDIDVYNSVIALQKIILELSDQADIKSVLNYANGNNVDFKTWLATINQPTTKIIPIDYQYLQSRLSNQDLSVNIDSALPLLGFVEGRTLRPFALHNSITTKDDLVREVSRIIGYETLQNEYIPSNSLKIAKDHYYNNIRIKELVASYGFYEIATRPFIHNKNLELVENPNNLLKLYNPYRDGVEILRSDLNISLLESLSLNIKDGFKDAKLFEIGKAYNQDTSSKIVYENSYVGSGIIGDEKYVMTSMINNVLTKLNINEVSTQSTTHTLGLKYSYLAGGQEVAHIIEVSNKTKKIFDLPLNKSVYISTINLPKDITSFASYSKYSDESNYPAIKRSYNLIIDNSILTAKLIDSIKTNDLDYSVFINPIERLPINETQDKVLLNIKYTSYSRTLTNDDIQSIETQISQYLN